MDFTSRDWSCVAYSPVADKPLYFKRLIGKQHDTARRSHEVEASAAQPGDHKEAPLLGRLKMTKSIIRAALAASTASIAISGVAHADSQTNAHAVVDQALSTSVKINQDYWENPEKANESLEIFLGGLIQLDTSVSLYSNGDFPSGSGGLNMDLRNAPAGIPVLGDDSGPNLDFSARNTTIGFGGRYTTEDGSKASLVVIADGFASFDDEFGSDETAFDFSQAFLTYEKTNGVSYRVGQTFTAFQDPDAIGYSQNPISAPGANFYDRRLGFAMQRRGENGDFLFALEEPKQVLFWEGVSGFGDFPDASIDNGLPDIDSLQRANHRDVAPDVIVGFGIDLSDNLNVGVRGIGRTFRYEGSVSPGIDERDTVFGGGGVFNVNYDNAETGRYWSAQGFYGLGVNSLLGGLKAPDGFVNTDGDIELARSQGGFITAGGPLGGKFNYNVTANYYVSSEDDDTAIDQSFGTDFNVGWECKHGFTVVAGYSYQQVDGYDVGGVSGLQLESDVHAATLSFVLGANPLRTPSIRRSF